MKKILITFICLITMASASFAETVMFNVKTLKIHNPNCRYAIKCTQNCIRIEKQKAKAKGGIPCKVCGG